jgi:hypothetical protein
MNFISIDLLLRFQNALCFTLFKNKALQRTELLCLNIIPYVFFFYAQTRCENFAIVVPLDAKHCFW